MSQACDTTTWPNAVPSAPATAPRGHDAVCHTVVLSACVAVLGLSFLLRPDSQGLSFLGLPWPWHCWLHETFGVNCALCGLSRAFCCLARGDVAGAVGFHRLAPLVFALFCLEVPYRVFALATHPRPIGARWVRLHFVVVAAVATAVFANWLIYLGDLIA